MTSEMIFRAICSLVTIIMFVYYLKREKKLLSFFTGAFTGSVALFLLNRYGNMLGVTIPLNVFNISGSIILGVPFVAFLVIMNFL